MKFPRISNFHGLGVRGVPNDLREIEDKDKLEEEDVIYSEGEALEVLYPNNTWDSDDALSEEHLHLNPQNGYKNFQ